MNMHPIHEDRSGFVACRTGEGMPTDVKPRNFRCRYATEDSELGERGKKKKKKEERSASAKICVKLRQTTASNRIAMRSTLTNNEQDFSISHPAPRRTIRHR